MSNTTPQPQLDERFSSAGASATPWDEVRSILNTAGVFWLSTVRPDGRPHVTPLLCIWEGDALHFSTGVGERKAHNLRANAQCVLTTGTNAWDHGLDVVVEGEAVRVDDDADLRRLASAWEEKYGADWHVDVRGGAFVAEGREALVFRVAPRKVLAFGKGVYSQTRYTF